MKKFLAFAVIAGAAAFVSGAVAEGFPQRVHFISHDKVNVEN